MKIVINRCYGGFGLSTKATRRLLELQGKECFLYKQTKHEFDGGVDEYVLTDNYEDKSWGITVSTKNMGEVVSKLNYNYVVYYSSCGDTEFRADADLVQVVEELGSEANGQCANLRIVEIPDDIDWDINDYDGMESVEEKHRRWC